MGILIQKFGGTSVGDTARIKRVAGKIRAEYERGHHVGVVVSAMSGETNRLVDLCHEIAPMVDQREYDTVVAAGEQITTGLLAMALREMGVPARSWQGWQLPIITDAVHSRARIQNITSDEIKQRLETGEVAIVAGFQGISSGRRITTLGRGGSDLSAVALAAALGAERCDIYTDVQGVYTTDPRIVSDARRVERIAYEEMLELASQGAKVLQGRAVELAMKYNVPLQVLSSFGHHIGSDYPGTLITAEDKTMEQNSVSGIAYSRNEAKVTLTNMNDRPGIAAAVFTPLADAAINVDMIVQNVVKEGGPVDLTFTVPRDDLQRTVTALENLKSDLSYDHLVCDKDVVKISLIGVGMRSHAGVAQRMFSVLGENGITIYAISTSEIKISVLINETYMELAVRALHKAYGLEKEAIANAAE